MSTPTALRPQWNAHAAFAGVTPAEAQARTQQQRATDERRLVTALSQGNGLISDARRMCAIEQGTGPAYADISEALSAWEQTAALAQRARPTTDEEHGRLVDAVEQAAQRLVHVVGRWRSAVRENELMQRAAQDAATRHDRALAEVPIDTRLIEALTQTQHDAAHAERDAATAQQRLATHEHARPTSGAGVPGWAAERARLEAEAGAYAEIAETARGQQALAQQAALVARQQALAQKLSSARLALQAAVQQGDQEIAQAIQALNAARQRAIERNDAAQREVNRLAAVQ